jgi:hypothetical protein
MASHMAQFLRGLIPDSVEDVQIVEDRARLPTETQLLEALGKKHETVRRGSLKIGTGTINKFLHSKDRLVTYENNKMDHSTVRFQNNVVLSPRTTSKNILPDHIFSSKDTIPPKPRRGSSAEVLNVSTESSCTADTSYSSSDVTLPMENDNTTFCCWETLKLDDEGGGDVNERNSQQRFYCSDSNLDYYSSCSFPPTRDTIPPRPLRSNSQREIDSCKDTTEGGQLDSVQPNSSPLGSAILLDGSTTSSISHEKLGFPERIYNDGAHKSESSTRVLLGSTKSFPIASPNSKEMKKLAVRKREQRRRTRGEGKNILMASGKDPSTTSSMTTLDETMHFPSYKRFTAYTDVAAGSSLEARICDFHHVRVGQTWRGGY